MAKSCVDRLLDLYGGRETRGAVAECARALGVSDAVVSNWKQKGFIPAHHALMIELATDGKIAALEVLADAYVVAPRKMNRVKVSAC